MEKLRVWIATSIFSWSQALGLPLVAAGLLGAAVHYSGLSSWLSAGGWIAVTPLLYAAWLMLYFALSAIEMQLLFRNYEKPRYFYTVGVTPESLRHARLIVCYLRSAIVRNMPMAQAISYLPGLGRLYFLAYAPSYHIGKNAFFAGFMYDPDLTEIGEETVVGGGCVLSSHSMSTKGREGCTYVSAAIRLGDRVTIGGESRIALGVTIDADAIVEPFSNVAAMTHIPAGEVWGGNPAVFLRKRTDLPLDEHAPAAAVVAVTPPASVAPVEQDRSAAARRIVARAINLSPDAHTDEHESAKLHGDWDSLVQMAIAATLADAYGCRLGPTQLMQLKTLADVERIIASCQQSAPSTTAPQVSLPTDPEWLPLLPSAEATRLLAQSTSLSPATHTSPLPIVIAASFTAEPLASSLSLWSAAFGVPTQIEFAGYNQITQALLAPQSLFAENATGLNVVLLRPEDLPEENDAAREALGELVDAVRQYLAREPGRSLIVGTLPPPVSSNYLGDRAAVDQLRMYWSDELRHIEGVRLLDFAAVLERIGLASAGDAAMELATRAPYSTAAYRELGIELARLVRRQRVPRAKVLALDCDNTLWGGVLGEDGCDNLQLGPDGPGRSFQAVQRVAKRLSEQGVLLVLVSRNEEADVLEVFDRHPGMILRRDDIAAHRINWQPKSQNLRELAAELNVGIDSFVFFDDDSAQRLEVATNVPSVHVFPTPADPAQYATALSQVWLFDAEKITAEDRERTQMIRQEQARQASLKSTEGLENYLQSLGLVVEMHEADAADIARVAQLTQKTNQFNLSLRRRTSDELKLLGNEYRLFVVSARDKFGSYGQIGACILRQESGESATLEIDTFLLSCRALGRGVEDAFLFGVCELARRAECAVVSAPYVAGPRNQPAREFFARVEFRDDGAGRFTLPVELARPLPQHVQFRLTDRDSVANG